MKDDVNWLDVLTGLAVILIALWFGIEWATLVFK